MRKKHIFTNGIILVMCIVCLSGCGTAGSRSDTKSSEITISKEMGDSSKTDKGMQLMNITLDGKNYAVALDDNETVKDIVTHMPLSLSMVRYAGHEYYAELPYTPVFDENRTSDIKAGHVYYWDGWNAFVINYVDYDISPYKAVHIGEITDSSIVNTLINANENINIQVTD